MAEASGHRFNGTGDLRECAADGGGNGGVLVVHQTDDFQRRHLVEIAGRGRNLFGGKMTKILFGGAGCGQDAPFGFRVAEIGSGVPTSRNCGGEVGTPCSF